MAKWGEFEFDEFKQLADSFRSVLDRNVIDTWIRELLLEIAYRAVAKIKKRTPVDSGHLRGNWQVGEIVRKGDAFEVEIYNVVEYAPWVEYGHRTGKNLDKWVEGRFMMTISMKEIERELPAFIQRKQIELINRLLGRKG